MVGNPRENGMRPVDLFEGDDEGKFVLEGEGTERPEQIRAFDDSCGESVCATDEKSACFSRIGLDFPYLFRKRSAGQAFSPLVKDQAKTSFAPAK